MEIEITLEWLARSLDDRTLKQFFRYSRQKYLHAQGLAENNETDCQLEEILDKISTNLDRPKNELWASPQFQLSFRLTKPNHLKLLGIKSEIIKNADDAIREGRMMSILPYNAILSETTLRKFLPNSPERFSGKWKHSLDPYGLFKTAEKIIAKDGTYLGTHKFQYAVLANITDACYVGCDGCYKGIITRTALSELKKDQPEYALIKEQLTLEEQRAIRQARLLAEWVKREQEVNTLVISGGEPTLFSNQTLAAIISEFKNIAHLKVVRICTSAIFQGTWYRIDDDFTEMLNEFRKTTGKQIYINAHVTDEFQLAAPEAKIAIEKLRKKGISIHLQMPLQQGINFDRDDLIWSAYKLRTISEQAYFLGVIPYKLILDMHSPSHPDFTVPIETVSKVLGLFDRHADNSDMQRWQACCVLHEQGNFYIYPYPNFAAAKEIDCDKVTYFIPQIELDGSKKIIIHAYEEPLLAGHNDNPLNMTPIADSEVNRKIAEVQEAYRQFRSGTLTEKEFFRVSNIPTPENRPLIR